MHRGAAPRVAATLAETALLERRRRATTSTSRGQTSTPSIFARQSRAGDHSNSPTPTIHPTIGGKPVTRSNTAKASRAPRFTGT